MTATAKPKMTGMAEVERLPGNRSATMMLPQPPKTRVKVPTASARDFLKRFKGQTLFRRLFEFHEDHVPDFAEFPQVFLLGFIGLRRVRKGPVELLFRPREKGAGFLGAVADRDDEIEGLIQEPLQAFGFLDG